MGTEHGPHATGHGYRLKGANRDVNNTHLLFTQRTHSAPESCIARAPALVLSLNYKMVRSWFVVFVQVSDVNSWERRFTNDKECERLLL
jgi:hypothetical protein